MRNRLAQLTDMNWFVPAYFHLTLKINDVMTLINYKYIVVKKKSKNILDLSNSKQIWEMQKKIDYNITCL